MAKKNMDLRGQIADLRDILQVQSLRLEKLELEMKMLKESITGLRKL